MAKGLGLKIFLAGRVAVEADGVVVDEGRLPGRQGRLLLAYLVVERGRPVPRDELAEALWGESLPATWDKALTVGVSKLRGLLTELGLDGATALTGAFGCYRLELPEGAWVDVIVAAEAVREAEEALAAGELEDAKAAAALAESLVQQPFLPGEEGAWVEEKRRELTDVRGRALITLADACLRSGDASEAVNWAEQTIALAPFRETGYRRLMEAHTLAGNRAEALRVYEQCRRLLAEELGAYPSPETESIYRELLGAPSPEPGVASPEAATGQDAQLDPPSEVATRRGRAHRRRGVLIAISSTLLLTAVAAVAGIELAGGGSPGLSAASANSVAAIDAGSNRLVADVPVGNGPTSVAIYEGSVWVANALDRTVSRVDPDTNAVVQRIDVGGDPSGIAVGGGAVWVANSLDGTVSRIDPQTNRVVQAIPVGVTPTAIAVDGRTVWVTSAEERSVTRIDVLRGRVVDRIPTDALGRGIAVGAGSVWVTDGSSRSVVRINARRGSVLGRVGVGNGPTGVAFGDGSFWVANSLDGTVSRIDSDTNRVTATIPVGEGPDGVAIGSGVVWVSGEFSEAIVRIDPAEDRVVERIPIANRPKGLAVSENRVWLSVQPSGAGHRGGRLVVATHNLISGSIDPSYMTWAGTLSSLSTAYDGLLGYARRGGSEGAQLVPNLAGSLPEITAGGTRYAFQLRRGIRYSDGTLVKASDFRRAFERQARALGVAPRVPLVGADACGRRPRSCDLSRGILTDDTTGTIVFQLRRPESQLLRELSFMSPIPRGTPDREMESRPVPSTGPYMIESYVPERALTLVRNPHFRVWSSVARPGGFPDEIEFRLGGPRTGVRAVERGQADIARVLLDREDAQRTLDDFKARYPSRFHVHAEQATMLLFLNTTHAPFDDVRVRRAVNLSVDRGAISGSYGGPTYAPPTCQYRPPGTVGFRRYCPYTAAPSRIGEWKAPDLTRARRLVAASGTLGTEVTVWTYAGFMEAGAEGAVRALEELGYRASIRRADDLGAYFAKATDEKTRGVQAGMVGWYGVPRTAVSLLDIFRCSPPDLSFFCNRRIDTRIARALEIQSTDPEAAVALWARLERDIVDLAPWVPLFTPSHAHVVSERVGNYQYNPEWRLLFDQLWVR